MGCSLWGCKELDMTERLSTCMHARYWATILIAATIVTMFIIIVKANNLKKAEDRMLVNTDTKG